MNQDDREEPSSRPVKSKYFAPKSDMDESLSDFQETKRTCAGPKNPVKSKSSKTKKTPKRTKGQKDIRTALRPKKNELESYSKDFDKLCKKAGIDIDSEQLQLAIALSKSLQDTASTSSDTSDQKSQVRNAPDKIGKIRTTLQEYGFKVPEVKIAANTRKIRKHRKNYKLISTSDTEKKEIIANKYSQVLFQNIPHCSLYSSNTDTSNIPVYYLASSATYDTLKMTDTFYVNNLIEKSVNTGNLLKDWSNIPGRPKSPNLFEAGNMNFSEIECSQDELDIVLSGSLKRSKNILRNKSQTLNNDNMHRIVEETKDVTIVLEERKVLDKNDHENILKAEYNAEEILEPISTAKQCRSCSPDLFDDDASSVFDVSTHSVTEEEKDGLEVHNTDTKVNLEVMDITKCVQSMSSKDNSINQTQKSKYFLNRNEAKRKGNDLVKSTECIQIEAKKFSLIVDKPVSQLSQNTNVTKRKSNDFMEITNCVATISQPLSNTINLTELPDIIEENTAEDETLLENHESNRAKPSVDTSLNPRMSQTSNNIDLKQCVKYHDDNIAYDDEIAKNLEEINPDQCMDLTQSSNTSDELPFVSLIATKSNSLDKTITIDVNEYARAGKKYTNLLSQEVHIDLTQYPGKNEFSNHNQSFFEEYNHDCSGNTEEPKGSGCKTDNELVNVQFLHSSKSKSNSSNSSDSNSHSKISSEEHGHSHWQYHEYNHISAVENEDKLLACISRNCVDVVEKIPVEYHRSNCGYKRCRPGQVDLTQSPERKSCYIDNRYQSKSYEKKSTIINLNEQGSCSASQPNLSNLDTIKSSEQISDHSIAKCLPVELHHSNSSNNASKSGKLDLTLSPIKQSSDNIIMHDIDLTQSSETSEELSSTLSIKESDKSSVTGASKENGPEINGICEENVIEGSQRYSSLGKKDDVSIDYDDFLDVQYNNGHNGSKTTSIKSIVNENTENVGEHSKNTSQISNCSQNSEVFEISDKELDYSMHQSKLETLGGNFVFGGISIMDELTDFSTSKKTILVVDDNANSNNVNEANENVPTFKKKPNRCTEISPIKHRRITEITVTPQKSGNSNTITVVTPQNSELIIKTNNVTPMLDYESMSTPEIHNELDKYGIKPFKRKRAIQLLTHIYNQTHPIIEPYADELALPPKRHKPNEDQSVSTKKCISPRKLLGSPRKILEVSVENDEKIGKTDTDQSSSTNKGKASNVNEKRKGKGKDKGSLERVPERIEDGMGSTQSRSKETQKNKSNQASTSKEIECKPEDWVFQKREKAKVHSCRVPLHIAFYNYVSSRRDVREAILCYEPVEIDVIHKDLVGYGHRYDPKDLLKFLDKKCITVKTTDNDARNQKRS